MTTAGTSDETTARLRQLGRAAAEAERDQDERGAPAVEDAMAVDDEVNSLVEGLPRQAAQQARAIFARACEERREELQNEPLVSNADLAEAAALGRAMAERDCSDQQQRERLDTRYLELVARFHGHALQQILRSYRQAWAQRTQELAVARERCGIRPAAARLAALEHVAQAARAVALYWSGMLEFSPDQYEALIDGLRDLLAVVEQEPWSRSCTHTPVAPTGARGQVAPMNSERAAPPAAAKPWMPDDDLVPTVEQAAEILLDMAERSFESKTVKRALRMAAVSLNPDGHTAPARHGTRNQTPEQASVPTEVATFLRAVEHLVDTAGARTRAAFRLLPGAWTCEARAIGHLAELAQAIDPETAALGRAAAAALHQRRSTTREQPMAEYQIRLTLPAQSSSELAELLAFTVLDDQLPDWLEEDDDQGPYGALAELAYDLFQYRTAELANIDGPCQAPPPNATASLAATARSSSRSPSAACWPLG